LKSYNAEHIQVFGGGGGTIIPREIKQLHDYGVAWVFSPEDGRKLGLQGMINEILKQTDFPIPINLAADKKRLTTGDTQALSRLITYVEQNGSTKVEFLSEIYKKDHEKIPVLGITGTGGAGKSSLTDELIQRFIHTVEDKKIAVLSIDPTK